MTTKKLTKLLALYLPYILLGLVATNFGEAWRMAVGADASAKMLSFFSTLPVALALASKVTITAPEAALAVMLSISMVGSLAKLEVFSENMRQVKFTVENLEEFLEMPELAKEHKAFTLNAGHSKSLCCPIRIEWFNNENYFTLHVKNNDVDLMKRYAETMVRMTFGTPDAFKLGKPLDL